MADKENTTQEKYSELMKYYSDNNEEVLKLKTEIKKDLENNIYTDTYSDNVFSGRVTYSSDNIYKNQEPLTIETIRNTYNKIKWITPNIIRKQLNVKENL